MAQRFLKYSEIQGEREKMANYRNFSQGCISLVYTPAHQYTFNIQRGINWVLRGASLSIQRYRLKEWKWQIWVTLAWGVNGGYTPLHTNRKELNGATRNIEGLDLSFNTVLTWRMEVFYLAGSRFCYWQL